MLHLPTKKFLTLVSGLVLAIAACSPTTVPPYQQQEPTCLATQRDCGGVCVDVTTNGAHCGMCNNACGQGLFCSGSVCGATCAAGMPCGNSCVDTQTDSSNCGFCGMSCGNGVACVGGVCAVSQSGAGGTSGGTGGGANNTGGQTGAGGGGLGTGGGNTASGGAGNSLVGGYHVHGDWAGFAFTFADGGATITPESFEDMLDTDGPYCVKGQVQGTPELYNSIGALGFNVSQPKIEDAPVNKVASTGDGVFVDITVNSGDTGIRVQLEDGTDPSAADAAEHRWCANLTVDASGKFQDTIPWDAFNTTCWDAAEGTPFDKREIAKVILYVPDPGEADPSLDFDFCVNDIGPANVQGRGTGEIVASCSNSVNWSGTQTDKYANIDGGSYRFQANGWNMVNGNMVIDLLPGAGFKMSTQSCNTDSDAPCSYPSVYVGTSADGKRSGGYSAKQISAIQSVPTCLGWNSGGTPASHEYNVSYDVWFASSSGAQNAEKFLMVWLRDPPSFQPGGMFPVQDGAVIGSQTWQVWNGPNHAQQSVTSYVAPNARADGKAYSFNLKDFIDDAVERGYLSPNDYLISIMGGMEIWGGAQGASITGFSAQVQ